MAEFGITNTGVVVPRTADLLEEFDARFEDRTDGIVLDSSNADNADQLLVILAGIFAEMMDELGQVPVALFDALDPDAATGVHATNLARIVGVYRKGATRSRVDLTLTGTPGAVIALGVVVQGGGPDGTATWTTLVDATIGVGGTVTGVTAECTETGPIEADPSTVTSIVTPRTGLTAATNPAAAAPGQNAESVSDLRIRRRRSTATAGAHTQDALLAALLAVDGVTDALVLDNPDNTTQTVSGVALPAHSYAVYVLPNPLSAPVQSAVLDAMQAKLHPNTRNGITAAFSRTVTLGTTATTYTLGVAYGTRLTVTVEGTLTLQTGTSKTDVDTELQAAITAHVATLRMGGALTRLTLCQLAASIDGVIAAAFTIDALDADLFPLGNQKIDVATLTTTVTT